jgi:hypothetical protein
MAQGRSQTQRATPLPVTGEVFVDARGGERGLRVTWHPEAGLVVLSLWRGRACVGSFRLTEDEVPALIECLAGGLAERSRRARDDAEQVRAS